MDGQLIGFLVTIGSIQVIGTNGSMATFTPCFVSNPFGLI